MSSLSELMWAYGTSEGVVKEWDARGRGKKIDYDNQEEGECVGHNCPDHEVKLPSKANVGPFPVVVPHLDNLEFMMTSNKGGQAIHWDKEAMKTMLRMALVQLDREDAKIDYLNTPTKSSTDHYATIKFHQRAETPEVKP